MKITFSATIGFVVLVLSFLVFVSCGGSLFDLRFSESITCPPLLIMGTFISVGCALQAFFEMLDYFTQAWEEEPKHDEVNLFI